MKRYELREPYGLDHLTLVEASKPEVGDGQVALRMRAVSLNARDLPILRGQYDPKRMPRVPLSDGVGEVIAVGRGVSRVAVGDRVMPTFIQGFAGGPVDRDGSYLQRVLGGPLDGVLTERLVVGAESVVRVPSHLSDVEAATLPCAGVTAWNALVGQGSVRAGDTVVVQGTGGVALFALQIAVALGARVIALSSSADKLARLRELGADTAIDYTQTPAWGKAVVAATGGIGADHVVDIGGAATLAQSIDAVRAGGTISTIGLLGGAKAELELPRLFVRNVRLQGIFVGSRRELEDVSRARIHPVIDRVFDFADARAAIEHFATGARFGKVCIQVAGSRANT